MKVFLVALFLVLSVSAASAGPRDFDSRLFWEQHERGKY